MGGRETGRERWWQECGPRAGPGLGDFQSRPSLPVTLLGHRQPNPGPAVCAAPSLPMVVRLLLAATQPRPCSSCFRFPHLTRGNPRTGTSLPLPPLSLGCDSCPLSNINPLHCTGARACNPLGGLQDKRSPLLTPLPRAVPSLRKCWGNPCFCSLSSCLAWWGAWPWKPPRTTLQLSVWLSATAGLAGSWGGAVCGVGRLDRKALVHQHPAHVCHPWPWPREPGAPAPSLGFPYLPSLPGPSSHFCTQVMGAC